MLNFESNIIAYTHYKWILDFSITEVVLAIFILALAEAVFCNSKHILNSLSFILTISKHLSVKKQKLWGALPIVKAHSF